MSPPDRHTAAELLIAGGLTAIGIAAGNPTVLAGLTALAASVGANWAADLAQAGYRRWCDGWFTPAGALNQDVQQALAISREIGDRRGQGIHAWNLGLALEKQGRHAEAARLMRILVEYEREIGHPDAEEDARRLAEVERKAE